MSDKNDLIDAYFSAMDFYADREKWHNKAAGWYFNAMREMEGKANKHLDMSELANKERGEYRELIMMAYEKQGFSFKDGSHG